MWHLQSLTCTFAWMGEGWLSPNHEQEFPILMPVYHPSLLHQALSLTSENWNLLLLEVLSVFNVKIRSFRRAIWTWRMNRSVKIIVSYGFFLEKYSNQIIAPSLPNPILKTSHTIYFQAIISCTKHISNCKVLIFSKH